jgi:hypothetical protein
MMNNNTKNVGFLTAAAFLLIFSFGVQQGQQAAQAQLPPPGESDWEQSSRQLADAAEELRESGEFNEDADLNAPAIDEGTAPEEEEETEAVEEPAQQPAANNKTIMFVIEGHNFVEAEVTAVLNAVNMTVLEFIPMVEGRDDIFFVTVQPTPKNSTTIQQQ